MYRQGQWDLLPGDALLPGDVISIGRPHGALMPALMPSAKPSSPHWQFRLRAGHSTARVLLVRAP